MQIFVDGEIVIGRGDGDAGITVPDLDWPLPRMRWDGENIIDAATISVWNIDDNAQKWIGSAPDRQALTCAWDDELIRVVGVWRVKTAKDELGTYLDNKRWQVETGGIVVNGLAVPTNDRTKTLIEGAAATLGDADTIDYEHPNEWVSLTGLQLRQMRDAISAHVQATFTLKRQLSADIESGAITTTAQVDAANWPG
jgi:Domain of unknown function (DUF4376)